MDLKVYEETNTYLFVITAEEDMFEYRWGKELPEGQTVEEYLLNCKREAELLVQHEIESRRPPQEITL